MIIENRSRMVTEHTQYQKTHSWTEAQWAESWTGGGATHKNVKGDRIEVSAEEPQRSQAERAKNRAKQVNE